MAQNKITKYFFFLLILVFSILIESCSIKYGFTGASIAPEIKTLSISDFPNMAPLVNPTLATKFVEKMKDRFSNQTSLIIINGGGDLNFEGEIVDFSTTPQAIQANEQAAQNRLTVTINVKYSNAYDPKQNFETRFSRYADYPSTKSIDEVQDGLIEGILDEIIDDIFNKSVANW